MTFERRTVSKQTRKSRKPIERTYPIPKGSDLYHGTIWNLSEGEYFTEFDPSYSDFGVFWFTKDDHIAEQFARGAHYHPSEDEFEVVMRFRTKKNLNLLDIDESQYQLGGDVLSLSEFVRESGIEVRDIYEHIDHRKYDGGKLRAHSGFPDGRYDDLALFDTKDLQIVEYKYLDDGNWSPWMTDREIINIFRKKSEAFQHEH
jgi:hypothetical protein